MPWEVYWDHLQLISSKLRSVFKDGRYNPTIIVGITNGGAMYADLLVREIFEGRPSVALWADRHNSTGEYFENGLNEAILDGILSLASEREGKLDVLLVDDIVASGTAIMKAIDFVQRHLPESTLRFLPLFSRNDRYFALVEKHVLWKDPIFNMTDEEAKAIHSTGWPILPYNKDIRST
jgi:hypoxanthine phosphoribosyltransferase